MSYEKENKKAEKINKQGLWENVGLKPNLQSYNSILVIIYGYM